MFKTVQALMAANVLDEFDWIARRSILVQEGLKDFQAKAIEREDYGTADMCETTKLYAASALGRAHFHRRYKFMEPISAAHEALIREGHAWNGANDYADIRTQDLSETQRILEQCEQQFASLGGTLPTAQSLLASLSA